VVGTPKLYNLIPVGARVTNIKAIGTMNGTRLTVGIETDAPTLISHPVAIYAAGHSYTGISAAATVNRSFALEALVTNITTGSVQILVEFMV
jgi:hypothetical protein